MEDDITDNINYHLLHSKIITVIDFCQNTSFVHLQAEGAFNRFRYYCTKVKL